MLSAACDGAGPSQCALGAEHVVARPLTHSLDAIVLTAQAGAPLALWSEPAGLFARRLDRAGKPVSAAKRIGPRCERGLAAVGAGARVLVACSERAEASTPAEDGSVVLLEVAADATLIGSERVAAVSPSSAGVALTRSTKSTDVVWHDGGRVMLHARGAQTEPRVLSATGRVAGPPAVATVAGRPLVTWSERVTEEGHVHNRLFASHGGPAVELGHADFASPLPQPIAGTRLLALRDQPDKDRKPGLFLAPLVPDRLGLGARVRVGRADGRSGPALVACLDGVIAAAPRTHGNEEFVSVQWIAPNLKRVRGGQQFFEDGHAFTQAAVLCTGSRALILIGEHTDLERPRTSLRTITYDCQ